MVVHEETFKKKDLELILEVNKKAIEIESEITGQYEEMITSLSELNKTLSDHIIDDAKIQPELVRKIDDLSTMANDAKDLPEKIKELTKKTDELSRDLFKMQLLYITGLISIVIQVIQIFLRK